MDLFRVSHPELGNQYFLVSCDSPETWAAEMRPYLDVGGDTALRYADAFVAYRGNVPKDEPRRAHLDPKDLVVERVSTAALDAIGRGAGGYGRAMYSLVAGVARATDESGARAFFFGAETPARAEYVAMGADGLRRATSVQPSAEVALGSALALVWGRRARLGARDYQVTTCGADEALGRVWDAAQSRVTPALAFAELRASGVLGRQAAVGRALWIEARSVDRVQVVVVDPKGRTARQVGDAKDLGAMSAKVAKELWPDLVPERNPTLTSLTDRDTVLDGWFPGPPAQDDARRPRPLPPAAPATDPKLRAVYATVAGWARTRAQIFETLGVLLGHRDVEEGVPYYGTRDQFALSGENLVRRVEYLRGAHEHLGYFVEALLTDFATTPEMDQIEMEDD